MGVSEAAAQEVMACASQIVIDSEHFFPVDPVVDTPCRVGNRQRQEPDKGALKRIRKLDADCLTKSSGFAVVGKNKRRSPKLGRFLQSQGANSMPGRGGPGEEKKNYSI